MCISEQAFDAEMLRKRRTAANAHCRRGYANSDFACSGFSLQYTQHGRLPRFLKMLNQIVDPGRQSIGINLHRRELSTQRRQALAEALPEMLELRVFQMRHSTGECRSTQAQGYGGRSQAKQRKHHV